jgi:hypothetical protein
MVNHLADTCPSRKKSLPIASLIGSADPRLEFYHIDCPDVNGQSPGMKNVGIVYIEASEISKEELAKEFSVIYKTSWPWQIRQLDEWTFLVRFPPHMQVEDVAGYPCFGLVKEGVTVNVEIWDGELENEGETQDVWVHLRKLKPKWCEWDTLARISSAFGIMVDVDWNGMFQSFYEVVRVKI